MTIKCFALILSFGLGQLAHTQSGVTTGNVSTYLGNNRWQWTVFVTGPPTVLSKINCVEYLLHPTFPNRDRYICDRGANPNEAFPLTTTGWGTFTIPVKVLFADGHTEALSHSLQFVSTSTAPSDCQTITSFSLQEHGIHDIGSEFPNLYLYAEEIHDTKPSHFYVLQATRAIDTSGFDWRRFKETVRPARVSRLSASGDSYEVVSSAVGEKLEITPVLQAIFSNATKHGSIRVDICKK